MSHIRGHRLSDMGFFCCSAVILGILAAVIVVLSGAFLQNIWMVGDTRRFFAMADVILQGGVPYVDYRDPKPPLIFFTLTIPSLLGQRIYTSLALTGLCNLISSLVILRIGWRLYGRLPGFAAGLLFLVNMALAEGFFILTEPFTVLFIILSVYALLFMDRKYLLSGIFAGIAIGFKQYALLLLPLALFYLLMKEEQPGAPALPLLDLIRKKELRRALELLRLYILYVLGKKDLRRAPELLAGVLIPLAIMFGAIFLSYGADACMSSLYWSFGVADTYFTQGAIGDVPAYRAASLGVALANVLLESGLFAALLAMAAASVLLDRPRSRHEKYFLLAAVAFLGLLVIRQYLHYWALALPFIVLLCVRPYRWKEWVVPGRIDARRGQRYLAIAALLFAIAIAAFASIEYVLIEVLWRPFDILSYYGLADPVAKMILGIVDGETALPPLLFSASLPAPLPWSVLIVGLLVFTCALIVTKVGMRSYGVRAGLLAGAIFTIGIVWVVGYLTPADALALALVLLSAYLVARGGRAIEHFASGVCAGLAACFGLFILVLLPASMFLAWKRKMPGYIPTLLAGALLPLAAVAILDFASYGSPIHGLSLDDGLAFAGISISGSPYRTTDAIMAIANIVLAVCLFTAIVPLALAGFAAGKGRTAADHYFLLAGLCFIASLFLKEYLHYWFMALPFMALLCARVFKAGAGGEERAKEPEALPAQRA